MKWTAGNPATDTSATVQVDQVAPTVTNVWTDRSRYSLIDPYHTVTLRFDTPALFATWRWLNPASNRTWTSCLLIIGITFLRLPFGGKARNESRPFLMSTAVIPGARIFGLRGGADFPELTGFHAKTAT